MAKDTPVIQEEPGQILDSIVVNTSPVSSVAASPRREAYQPDEDQDEDIWMATLDDEPTPRVTRSVSARMSSPFQPRHQSPEQEVGAERASEAEEDALEDMDYGYLPPAGSDVSSIDEPPTSARRPDDTIAQGEDFSQILMDSIPSLRETLRSSVYETTHNYFGEETSVIVNNTLEALRRSTAQRNEAEEASVAEPSLPVLPDPVVDEPEERAKMPQARLGIAPSPRRNRDLNLSPRWTQSPRRAGFSPLRQQVLTSQARQTDDVSKAVEDEQHDIRSSASRRRWTIPSRRDDAESNLYDDSFSEVPQSILDTATPRHKSAPVGVDDTEVGEQQADEIEDEDEEMDLIEDPEAYQDLEAPDGPLTASNPSVVSAGRLPTPDDTPPQVDAEAGQDQDKETRVSQSSPLAAPPIRPDDVPEIVEISEDESEDEDEEDEEIERSLQEYLDSQHATSLPDEDPPQVEETPINQMTSPLQEPQSVVPEAIQEKMARPALSPIVRAGRALQSVTSDPPSPEPRENQLRSPFRGSATKESGFASRGLSASPRRPVAYPDVNQLPSAGEAYDDPFGSDTRHTGQVSFMEALSRSSTAAAPKSHISSRESAASSMRITPPSEDEMSWVANEGPISANLRGDVSLREVARRSGSGAVTSKPDAAVAVTDEAEAMQEDHGDEMDIWEFEAQRETPRSKRQQPFGKKVAISSGRRSALPSPWTKQRVQMQKNTEEAPPMSEVEEELVDDDMTEDAAPEMTEAEEYSLLTQRQKTQQASSAHKSATKASRFELSTFFSSPAIVPGTMGDKFAPARAPGLNARTNAPQQEQPEVAAMPTSSMFPQITQKQNFTPRPRAQDEPMADVPSRAGAPTPPRMQLSHADIQKWQQETLNANEVAAEPRRTLLRPLPSKNASPSKSSLRSPLKPHTPGRVVEFTSSVLSPVEQAKVRHQRRMSQSSASAPPSAIRPAPSSTFMARLGAFPKFAPPQDDGQEDGQQTTNTATSEIAPEVQSSEPESLSQTVWTRQHWELLVHLIQMRRAGPFDPPYERRADRWLGEIIKTRGERVKIERWHLDCVDAFKAEVGGWDEYLLAKRFIGLILGDEKRGQGIVMPRLKRKRRREMFH